MTKPKIAFFDLSCCEGCQLQLANMGELLLDVLELVDVVEFREVMSEKWEGNFDVALVEGSVTDDHSEERLKAIRGRSKVLVAFGACAATGGVNGMKNSFDLEEIGKYVYGADHKSFPTRKTRPLHQVVKVDYTINNCPAYIPELVEVLKHILKGLPYAVPDYPVCVECKFNENVCMYERGAACMGPVTRAGCGSQCINNNNICYGCRGMVSNPRENAARDIMAKYNITPELIAKKMEMYNKCREEEKNVKKEHHH
ncbi:MAG: cytochrome B [Elusimicrobiota bacterium]|nr:cytochrome B [Elusimicrobiota bacterium]